MQTVSESSLPAVLILHGDRSTAAAYDDWLDAGYETHLRPPSASLDPPDGVDVVVLDWGLDRSVRAAILESEALADAAVLAVHQGVPASDPIEAGADDYLLSPIGEGELRAAVERAYLQRAYREWVAEFLHGTAAVDDEVTLPPTFPPPVEEAREAMDTTLAELVEEVSYPTLFRSLIGRDEAAGSRGTDE